VKRERLDRVLVSQGWAATRAKAKHILLAGEVYDERGRCLTQPGRRVSPKIKLVVKAGSQRFVSRGGLKLEAALNHFNVEVEDLICLDVGASTGGFSDCLLQNGARVVYAVDVGRDQLAPSLRKDARLQYLEGHNIRTLGCQEVPQKCDLVVIDVSFISLRLVLPHLFKFLARPAVLVALVKPQFEVGASKVGKGGIVKSEDDRRICVDSICQYVKELDLEKIQTMLSPVVGAKGNREYLLKAEFNNASRVDITGD
jgi:23S rRNA (cytidine1920-2'-O)/16S rRNA (cytidine1409-2'-O)-methyltransferase